MIRSLRQFLVISLLASIAIASSITAIGNYILDRHIISPLLDNQLQRAFSLVELTLQNASDNDERPRQVSQRLNDIATSGTDRLFFAILSPQKKLLFHSDLTPEESLSDIQEGFSEITINQTDWRAYAATDPATGNRIILAESHETRDHLIDSISRNNIYILLFTYPFFGIMIWLIVSLALRSITRVTEEIASRAPNWLQPVPEENIPIEIQPLVSELNRLFARVKLAFDRSRRFAGDAAHELRTPLAAIRTQAQVALRAQDSSDGKETAGSAEISDALHKVMRGVDRSSHIINQLLTLSRLGHEEGLNDISQCVLHRLATETLASLFPFAREKNISLILEPPPSVTKILGNDISVEILMRNIIDNAIRYTPHDGTIHVEILNEKGRVIFEVIDTGPGIPKALHESVFGRFYRILGNEAQGSGLGLAIVLQIAKLHHADITLDTGPEDRGLCFRVIFPSIHGQREIRDRREKREKIERNSGTDHRNDMK
jgi:two-component system, OmpR family, sensor histidine kinase QseC